MQTVTAGLVAWPGWPHLRLAAAIGTVLALLFAVVYVGADHLSGLRATRIAIHLEFEPSLPLIPAFTLVYMSVYVPFIVMPFVLRTREQLVDFAVRLGLMTLCAGLMFLLLPAELAFIEVPDHGVFAALLAFADRLNLDHNLVPSLHVAYGTLSMAAWWSQLAITGRILAAGWVLALAASALLTHQHHLVDVSSGVALGWCAHRLCRRVATEPRSSRTVDERSG